MFPANDACQVRQATPDDHHHLQEILDGSSGSARSRVFGLTPRDLLDNHHVHLGFVEGRPVGCVMATLGDTTLIHGLSVVQDRRGNGHADTLVKAALDHINENHAPGSFWTAVDPNEEGAANRFVRLGFDFVDGVECCGLRHLFLAASSIQPFESASRREPASTVPSREAHASAST